MAQTQGRAASYPYAEGTLKRRRRKRGGRRHPVLRAITAFFTAFFILLLVIGIICVVLFFRMIADAPDLSTITVSPTSAATYIYDAGGARQRKLTLAESNRDLVAITDVPADLQHAFVAIEDSRFYQHDGVDPLGIARALFRGVTSGHFSEGASTITQQLLKNTVFSGWTSEQNFAQRLTRKVQEQYLALQLEKVMSKEQILQDYMNIINLGAGCYGVQAASYCYFGRSVTELTLSECAVIAAITQNPSRYNPITHPEENAVRRRAVLEAMLSQGYIGQAAFDEALADDVYARVHSNGQVSDDGVSVYTYYEDALIDQVLSDLQTDAGYTYKQACKAVYAGGLRIYSAQDPAVQRICDEEFDNPRNFPAEVTYGIDYALSIERTGGQIIDYGTEDLRAFIRRTFDPSFSLVCATQEEARSMADIFRQSVLLSTDTVLGERITITPQPQASIVIIDQSTGYVRAIVGGRGKKEASLTLNRATYTTRQPGSTFKILSAYAPALDQGGLTLASMFENTPLTYADGTPVNNWDINDYGDPVTMREAIVRSINVAAVRCITQITPQAGFASARAFGISTLTDGTFNGTETLTDVTQALALGGTTYGVTNIDLCGAYACIAAQGAWRRPSFYTKVTDSFGNVLLDRSSAEPSQVIRPVTAALLTSAMEDVISDPSGTAYGAIDLGSMPAAGKSGTTSDYRDIWFAGYTPYYTCCVWGGYDNNAPLPSGGTGHTYSKLLWNAVMSRLHADLPVRNFPAVSGLVSAQICSQTGMAASGNCPAVTELFADGSQPGTYCTVHGSGGIVQGTGGASFSIGDSYNGAADPSAGGAVSPAPPSGGGTSGDDLPEIVILTP